MGAGGQCAVRTGASMRPGWSVNSLAWALHLQLTRYRATTFNSHMLRCVFVLLRLYKARSLSVSHTHIIHISHSHHEWPVTSLK